MVYGEAEKWGMRATRERKRVERIYKITIFVLEFMAASHW